MLNQKRDGTKFRTDTDSLMLDS